MNSNTEMKAKSASRISDRPVNRSLGAFFKHWEWMLVFLIIMVVFVSSSLSPYFLNGTNMARASSDYMEIGLMMLPMTFVILTGNTDLSIASNMGMSASFMGMLHNMGVNIWVAALAGLLLGTLGGALNGLLVSKVKLPALVVTLGTYAFFRGVAYICLGDQAARHYPEAFTYFGQGKVFGTQIPFSVALFVVLAIVFGFVLHRTVFGRYLYAIGNNEDTAIYSGAPVAKLKFWIYVLTGFLSSLAGLIMAARFGSTRPDNGTGLELTVITAVVLGGVDINGGSGSMYGAILSLLLISLLKYGMGLLNIQGQVQSMVIGLLLIFSILLPNVTQNISENKKNLLTPKFILTVLLVMIVFGAFIYFFFWSRAPIIASV